MIFHSIQDIRKKMMEDEKRKEMKQTDVYPFWNIPENKPCVIRFLPDGNEDNVFFWVERQMISLPFPGTESNPTKPIVISVPCVEMYGQNRYCPVMQELRKMFKDPDLADTARKYWKKRAYLFQGFVVEDPLQNEVLSEENLENPIKKFIINPSIFKIIQSSIMDTEIEESPVHFEYGRDFRLIRTKKGQFSDYSVSKWSMKVRPLNSFELEAIDKYGLYDLSSLLPKEPSQKDLEIIFEMFKASVNEELCKDEWRMKYYGREVNNEDFVETENRENREEKEEQRKFTVVKKPLEERKDEEEDEDHDYTNKVMVEKTSRKEVKETVNKEVEVEENDETESVKKKTDPKSILERLKQRNKK